MFIDRGEDGRRFLCGNQTLVELSITFTEEDGDSSLVVGAMNKMFLSVIFEKPRFIYKLQFKYKFPNTYKSVYRKC